MRTTICLLGTLAVILGGSQAAETRETFNTTQAGEMSGAAIVRGVRGPGVYTLPGSTVEKALRVGAILPEGSTIRTKSGASADLAMVENGVVIRVTPDTTVNLQKLRYVKNGKQTVQTHTILNVPEGKILSNGPRSGESSTYQVITAPVTPSVISFKRQS